MRRTVSGLVVGLLLVVLAFGQQQSITNGGSGSALPVNCVPGSTFSKINAQTSFHFCIDDGVWIDLTAQGGEGVPAGTIIMRDSGGCGAGWTEIGEMAGRTPLGTTAAGGDVATLGGSDSVNAVLSHTHAVNVSDSGHNHTQSPHSHIVTSQTATTGAATSYEHGVLDTSSAEAEATEVTATTTALNNPSVAGINASTDSPAGSVTSFDNRSAFRRVLFCRKN